MYIRTNTKSCLKRFVALAVCLACLVTEAAWAVAGGSLSGMIKDPSGAAIPKAQLTLTNVEQKTTFKSTSDARGFYSFPALPVGHYDLRAEAPGFKTQEKKNLTIDTDAALRADIIFEVGERQDVVTVTAAEGAVETQPDTVATHLGEVVSSSQMEAVPLN